MHTQTLMIVIAVALAFSPAVCDELPAGADRPQLAALAPEPEVPEPEATEVPVPTPKPPWRQPPAATLGLLVGKGGLYGNVIRLAPMLNVTADERSKP